MHLCIVSPHLDDAVLSCGVRMQRVVAAGGQVTVINIFNAGTGAAVRRAEEEAALSRLGARAIYLDELDAPDRDPRYRDDTEIFSGDFAAVPKEFILHIAARLAESFRAEQADEVIFPLAAGTHIDHRIAYAAGRVLAEAAPSLPQRYYEDRPYILWTGMLQARMNGIGCDAGLPAVTLDDMAQHRADYHFVSGGGKFPRSLEAAALMPPARQLLKGTADELVASADEVANIYDSLACYGSQMPHIFPDRQTFLRENASHEKARSGRDVYAERSWRLSPI